MYKSITYWQWHYCKEGRNVLKHIFYKDLCSEKETELFFVRPYNKLNNEQSNT